MACFIDHCLVSKYHMILVEFVSKHIAVYEFLSEKGLRIRRMSATLLFKLYHINFYPNEKRIEAFKEETERIGRFKIQNWFQSDSFSLLV